jgi:uncharacterized protein (TIGR03000 family)
VWWPSYGYYYSRPYTLSYYNVPNFTYAAPSYVGTSTTTAGYTPSTRPERAAIRPSQASFEVILPDAEAELQINDRATTSLGAVRQFETPDLEAGQDYAYTFVATWKQNGQARRDVRRVEVRAGSRRVVDFTRAAASESIPVPAIVRSPWGP